MSEIECQIGMCVVHAGFTAGSRRRATVAIAHPYRLTPPVPACDQCAVETVTTRSASGLGFYIVSLDEWRNEARPRAEAAMAQLRHAKSPHLEESAPPEEPRALTTAQGVPQDERPPDAPEAPADAPVARAPGGARTVPQRRGLAGSRLFRPLLLVAALSIFTGIILVLGGAEVNGQAMATTGGTPGAGLVIAGALMVLVPPLAVAVGLVVMFIRDEIREYPAQKTTMPSLHPMTADMATSEYERC